MVRLRACEWSTVYLCIQIQVCELPVADARHRLTVHSKVHLSPIAFYRDVVPVQIIKKASSRQCNPAINLVDYTASCKPEARARIYFLYTKYNDNIFDLRWILFLCTQADVEVKTAPLEFQGEEVSLDPLTV